MSNLETNENPNNIRRGDVVRLVSDRGNQEPMSVVELGHHHDVADLSIWAARVESNRIDPIDEALCKWRDANSIPHEKWYELIILIKSDL